MYLLFCKSNVLYKKLTISKFVVIIIFKLRFSGKVLITSFCILNFWHHHNFSWLYWIMFYWLFPLISHQHHFELHNSIIGNQIEIILLEIPYCCPKIKFLRKQSMNFYFIKRSFDCAKIFEIVGACISSIFGRKGDVKNTGLYQYDW